MNILFLTPYPLNKAPSQRFRFEHFFKDIEEKGWNWHFHSFMTDKGWASLYGSSTPLKVFYLILGYARRKLILLQTSKYDCVFIHRELTPLGPPVYEWFLAKILRKKIIYDFDDAIWMNDGHDGNKLWTWLKWRSKVARVCEWSWKVSVGNEYLAEFARKYCDQVVVNPTVVNTDVHRIEEIPKNKFQKTNKNQTPNSKSQKPVVGWTGSHTTLFYLEEVIPALIELEERYEFEFCVIANMDPKLNLGNYRFVKWSQETEVEDLAQFDIGIMPLEDTEWANGKCGFKLIQYGALGIPSIASPVGVNTEIIQDGENGFLASTQEEWIDKLSQLIESPSLREELGKAGRKTVVEKYSVEANKGRYLELFEGLVPS